MSNAPLWQSAAPLTKTGPDDHLVCTPPSPPHASKNAPFGPWSPHLHDATERGKQLRALAALSAVFVGSDHEIVDTLRKAEHDASALRQALMLFDGLHSMRRRHIIATFATIMPPRRER
jgi:hypothetical protein